MEHQKLWIRWRRIKHHRVELTSPVLEEEQESPVVEEEQSRSRLLPLGQCYVRRLSNMVRLVSLAT
jgi:hypothetical protein